MDNTLHIIAVWTHILGIALFVGPQFFLAFAWVPASRGISDLPTRTRAMRTITRRFAWIGGTGPADAFYYRIHSPVILIEFDHQTPVALPGARVPGKAHIHTVVRTPNGNDYGKDLLRQHYEQHKHDPAHGHR